MWHHYSEREWECASFIHSHHILTLGFGLLRHQTQEKQLKRRENLRRLCPRRVLVQHPGNSKEGGASDTVPSGVPYNMRHYCGKGGPGTFEKNKNVKTNTFIVLHFTYSYFSTYVDGKTNKTRIKIYKPISQNGFSNSKIFQLSHFIIKHLKNLAHIHTRASSSKLQFCFYISIKYSFYEYYYFKFSNKNSTQPTWEFLFFLEMHSRYPKTKNWIKKKKRNNY